MFLSPSPRRFRPVWQICPNFRSNPRPKSPTRFFLHKQCANYFCWTLRWTQNFGRLWRFWSLLIGHYPYGWWKESSYSSNAMKGKYWRAWSTWPSPRHTLYQANALSRRSFQSVDSGSALFWPESCLHFHEPGNKPKSSHSHEESGLSALCKLCRKRRRSRATLTRRPSGLLGERVWGNLALNSLLRRELASQSMRQ